MDNVRYELRSMGQKLIEAGKMIEDLAKDNKMLLKELAEAKKTLADEIKEHEAEQKDSERDFDSLYAKKIRLLLEKIRLEIERIILKVSDYPAITHFPEGWRQKLAQSLATWLLECVPGDKVKPYDPFGAVRDKEDPLGYKEAEFRGWNAFRAELMRKIGGKK
jgi:hypothetical protein